MYLLVIWLLPFLPSFYPSDGEARIFGMGVFLSINWVAWVDVIDSLWLCISVGGRFLFSWVEIEGERDGGT